MLVVGEAERQLQPRQLAGYLYMQLHGLSRLPTRLTQLVDRLETGTLRVGIVPTGLEDADRLVRSVANRIGAALLVVGLRVSSALMARVNDPVALVGFCLSAAVGLYMLWKIIRTPGEL